MTPKVVFVQYLSPINGTPSIERCLGVICINSFSSHE